jgi:hypothetical protein
MTQQLAISTQMYCEKCNYVIELHSRDSFNIIQFYNHVVPSLSSHVLGLHRSQAKWGDDFHASVHYLSSRVDSQI